MTRTRTGESRPLWLYALVPMGIAALIAGYRSQLADEKALEDATKITWSEQHSSAHANDNFTVTIYDNGKVEFEGRDDTLFIGRHEAHISPAAFQRVIAELSSSGFRDFSPRFHRGAKEGDGRTQLCVEAPQFQRCSEIVAWKWGGASAPAAYYQLTHLVRETVALERWTRVSQATADVFRDEGLSLSSDQGTRVVYSAVKYHSDEEIRRLLSQGFPAGGPAAIGERFGTPVELAASEGRAETVRDLIDAGAWRSGGANIRIRTLAAAIYSCSPEVLQAVTSQFQVAPPNTPELFACGPSSTRGFDELQAAEFWLDRGADPNTRDAEGRNALFFVRDPRAAALLIERGADPNVVDRSGRPPLLAALNEDVALALIKGGADFDVTTPKTPDRSIDERASRLGWREVQALLAARRFRAP